jgi:hypothetical protein
MDPALIVLIVVGVIVCTLALRSKSADIGSGDYTGWDVDGDGDGD